MLGPSLSSQEEWAKCERCGVDFVRVMGGPMLCLVCEDIIRQQIYDGLPKLPDSPKANNGRTSNG